MDKKYFLLAWIAASSIFVCLGIAYLAINEGAMGIAFLFASAVLLFIWPLVVRFVVKYAQGKESLQWLMDIIAIDSNETQKINSIRF